MKNRAAGCAFRPGVSSHGSGSVRHSTLMTFRRVFLVSVFVGAFAYLVSFSSFHNPFGHADRSALTLTEAHAAPAFNAAELNNIAVYKRVVPSVVNITAGTLTLDFFYGLVPQEDQGTGFILDKQGHILTNY